SVARPVPPGQERIVTDRWNHEQVTCSRRRHVGHAHALGAVARQLIGLVVNEIPWLPAAETECAEPAVGVDVPTGIPGGDAGRDVGQDYDRELEALGLVDRHDPDALARFLYDRRLRRLTLRLFAESLDEATERDAAGSLVRPRKLRNTQ